MSAPTPQIDPSALGPKLDAIPAVGELRAALGGERAFLVGGVVRDLLLGAERGDLDVAVEGDAIALADRLGAPLRDHARFGTAAVEIAGKEIDLASTRTETYAHPGALPDVAPADIQADLARRDFTVNAMAVPLDGDPELLDPHGGLDDLRAGRLRVLHDGSFDDDPTRALRAARYAARFDFDLDPRTAELLERVDLGTVSHDRVAAELRRIAAEERPAAPFALLALWGLAGVDAGAPARVEVVDAILAEPGWGDLAAREEVLYAVAVPEPELEAAALRLASASPATPSAAYELARGRTPFELIAGRAAGAEWLDDYIRRWRHIRLEIDGSDLLAAGVPDGPAVGRGLAAALRAKLDGEVDTREGELRVALAAGE